MAKKKKNTNTIGDEAAYLAAYDASVYPRPSVSVDVALFTVSDDKLFAAVYRRTDHPGKGTYAMPGGFVRERESLAQAVDRILADKMGLKKTFTEQLYTFGAPDRDPRTRVITVAYLALVAPARFEDLEKYDACAAEVIVDWPGETGGAVSLAEPKAEAESRRPLFLDHGDILGAAVKRLRGKLDYAPLGFQLLGESFTLRALQRVHETVRNAPLNKDSFRRRMLASGQLEATGEREENVSYRPAELYRFVKKSAL